LDIGSRAENSRNPSSAKLLPSAPSYCKYWHLFLSFISKHYGIYIHAYEV